MTFTAAAPGAASAEVVDRIPRVATPPTTTPVTPRVVAHDLNPSLFDQLYPHGTGADADGVRAVGHSVPFHQEFGRAEVGDAASVTLRIAVVLPSGGPMMRPGAPDLVTLAVVDGEAVTDLATLDGRHLSTEVAGGFTGRTVGVECLSGTVTVRRFEYRALEAAPAPTLADIIVAHHDA